MTDETNDPLTEEERQDEVPAEADEAAAENTDEAPEDAE